MFDFGKVRIYRSPEGDGNGGGGTNEGDKPPAKLAGKFDSPEALEKGYKEIESQFGSKAAENARLKQRVADLEGKSRQAGDEAAVKASITDAQKAYDDFNDKTDWDELKGRDLAVATRTLAKLESAVEAAKEGHSKLQSQTTAEAIRSEIHKNLANADSAQATKLMKANKIEANELIGFYNDHECGTYTEAVWQFLYEKQSAEVTRLKKIEEGMAKTRVHNEPEPRNPKTEPGKSMDSNSILERLKNNPVVLKYYESVAKRG